MEVSREKERINVEVTSVVDSKLTSISIDCADKIAPSISLEHPKKPLYSSSWGLGSNIGDNHYHPPSPFSWGLGSNFEDDRYRPTSWLEVPKDKEGVNIASNLPIDSKLTSMFTNDEVVLSPLRNKQSNSVHSSDNHHHPANSSTNLELLSSSTHDAETLNTPKSAPPNFKNKFLLPDCTTLQDKADKKEVLEKSPLTETTTKHTTELATAIASSATVAGLTSVAGIVIGGCMPIPGVVSCLLLGSLLYRRANINEVIAESIPQVKTNEKEESKLAEIGTKDETDLVVTPPSLSIRIVDLFESDIQDGISQPSISDKPQVKDTRYPPTKPTSEEHRRNQFFMLPHHKINTAPPIDPEEILTDFDLTLATNPKNTSALCGRGNALLSLGRALEALASFEAALAIDPKYKLALKGRLECLTRLGGDATTHKIKHLSDTRDSKLLEPIFIANFRDYLISTPHAHALAEILITHPTLTRLYVDRTQLKDAGLVVLAEALSQNFRLITLTFKKNPGLTQTSALFQRQINAHLYRNRLLTAKQLTPKALHELDFSVLSGDDLRCVLERHPNMKYWNFSAKQLSPKTVVLQPRYLPNYPTLRRLNLCDNQLRNEGAEQIALLLKAQNNPLPGLQILELGNNRIQALGFRHLAEAISMMVLEILDLQQNNIQLGAGTLQELASIFSKNSKLQCMILSGNELLPSADAFLSRDKQERKEITPTAPSGPAAFFHSKPIAMKSVIDSRKQIYSEEWVVALSCPKGYQHAMLYLEGMRNSGQRFLKRYHIVAPNVILRGKAKVVEENLEMGRFIGSCDKHDFWVRGITRIKGEELQSHIRDQEESLIPFSKYYDSTNGEVNCAGWCRDELLHIGIHDVPTSSVPRFAAQGYNFCAIS